MANSNNNSNSVFRLGLGGASCAGTSSVAKRVAAKLGVECFSIGEYARQLAREHGFEDLNHETLRRLLVKLPNFDRLLEDAGRNFVLDCERRGVGCVIEGRLPFLALQGVEGARTVLLTCDDLQERITREIDRQKERGKSYTREQARDRLVMRDGTDDERYRGLYNLGCFDPQHYMHYWDTSDYSAEESADKIIEMVFGTQVATA